MAGRVGRPKGVKNKPNPVKEHLAAKGRKRAPGRDPQELTSYRGISSLKMDSVSHTVLKLQAWRRDVPVSTLVSDILNEWLRSVTDYEQSLFKEVLPRGARAAKVPERWAGYLDSLGFVAAPEQPPLTAPLPAVEQLPLVLPHMQPEPTLADMVTPYRHPFSQGPAAYPHPAPTLPGSAQLFDSHSQKRPTGTGNAAQRATDNPAADLSDAPLSPEVEAYLEHYRVKPEDVR